MFYLPLNGCVLRGTQVLSSAATKRALTWHAIERVGRVDINRIPIQSNRPGITPAEESRGGFLAMAPPLIPLLHYPLILKCALAEPQLRASSWPPR